MANPRFTYKARQQEDWDKRSTQSGSKFAGYAKDEYKMFSPKKGDNYIRILPPTWEDPRHYGYDIWVHFGVGPDSGTVLCLWKMKQKPCPICEEYAKAEAAGREDAGEYKPTRRVLVWLLNRNEEKEPLLWGMPWTLDRDIAKLCKDRQTGELYQIDHPDSGYDISFEREGEPPIVKYVGTQLSRRTSEVDSKHLDYIIEHPLPEVLFWRSYEEVKILFEGGGTPAPAEPAPAPQQREERAQPQAKREEPARQPEVQAPARVEEAPAEEQEYCDKSIKFMGKLVGCTHSAGHKGECEFGREIEEAQAPQPEPKKEEPKPAPAATAVSSRAASLRQKFTTGGK